MNVLEKILEEIEEYEKKKCSGGSLSAFESGINRGCLEAKNIIRSHMNDVENDGWIPVKWRATTDEDGIDKEEYPLYIDCPMPNDGDEILITSKNGYVSEDTCYDDDGYYLDSGLDWVDDVKAWMPKPEGYRGE